MNATDPLNLVGVVVPGATVAAVRTRQVTYVDGIRSWREPNGHDRVTRIAVSDPWSRQDESWSSPRHAARDAAGSDPQADRHAAVGHAVPADRARPGEAPACGAPPTSPISARIARRRSRVASSTTSTAAPKTRSPSPRTRRRSAGSSSARACCVTSARSTRRPRSSAARSRSRSCSRPRASRAASIPTVSSPPRARPRAPHLPYTLSTLSTYSIEEVAAAAERAAVVPGLRVARPRHGQGDDRARRRVRVRGDRAHRRHRGARPARPRRAPRLHHAAQARARHPRRRRPASRVDVALRALPIRSASPTSSGATWATAPARSRSPTTSTRSSIRRSRGATSTGSAACGTARS